jgi:hypothetical protein
MATATAKSPAKSAAKSPATSPDKLNGISSDAVKKATGKTWPQWLKLLDAAGCKQMDHKQIVAVVSGEHEIGPWWQQMVTVGYEQARGRQRGQKPDGFGFSVSKTIAASAAAVYDAWVDAKQRAKWLEDELTITKSTPSRSVRFKWEDDDTRGNAMLYPKGAGKCQITVEHNKLPTAVAAAKMKKYWARRLDELKKLLEG